MNLFGQKLSQQNNKWEQFMSNKKTVNPFSESSEQLAKEFDEAAMDN